MDNSKKKQTKIKCGRRYRDTASDAWIYSCIKRGTYFLVATAIGKRKKKTCKKLIEKIPGRFVPLGENTKAVFYSDGNNEYTKTLPQHIPLEKLEYGQLVKIRKGGRLVKKKKKIIYGNPSTDDIETTNIENQNGIMRERIGRLVRKTKCISKEKCMLESAVELFLFYWNFMHVIHDKKTPAILEGISEDVILWHQFFYFIKYR